MKRRCEACKQEFRKDNKTTAVCDVCSTATCSKHYIRVCASCYLKELNGSESEYNGDDEDDDDDDVEKDKPQAPKPTAPKRSRIDSVINL